MPDTFYADQYLSESDAERMNYLAAVADNHARSMRAFRRDGKRVPDGYLVQLDAVIEEMKHIRQRMAFAMIVPIEEYLREETG